MKTTSDPDDISQKITTRRRRIFTIGATLVILAYASPFALNHWLSQVEVERYADYVDCWGFAIGVIPLTKAQASVRENHYRFEISGDKILRVVYANSAGTPINHSDNVYANRQAIQEFVRDHPEEVFSHATILKNAMGETVAEHSWGMTDQWRDRVDIRWYAEIDPDSTPDTDFMRDPQTGIPRLALTRDEETGWITRRLFKQRDDSPSYDANGAGGFDYILDELGRVKVSRTLDGNGHPSTNKAGVAAQRYEYHPNGRIAKTASFGIDGQPILNEHGIATCVAKYDGHGNKTEEAYYGADGKPCLTKEGCAKWAAKYDERGNAIEAIHYDTEGNWCIFEDGYSKWIAKYGKRGKPTEYSYYGTDGKPCLTKDGCAKTIMKYDRQGNQTEESYYGTDGNPCLAKDGCAKWVTKYDKHGNPIEFAAYGTDGKPCLIEDSFAKWTATFNMSQTRIEIRYYGVDGKPCQTKDGYAKIIRQYDEYGELNETRYGLDGTILPK